MALLSIDELNTPKVEVEPPEQYFSKMAISKEQKEERVETTNDFMDVLLFFFALLAIEMQAVQPDYDMVYRSFRSRWRDVVRKHSRMDDYQEAYVNEYTQQQFDTTKQHMESVGVGTDGRTDAGWWTSPDRAMAIGENEANSVLNYEELQKAIAEGYTQKQWVTERDNRVRRTHMEVDGRTIPIQEYFVVGNSAMMMPHDSECFDAREIVNCRCSLKFIGKGRIKYSEQEKTDKPVDDTSVNYDRLSEDALRKRLSVLGETEGVTNTIVASILATLEHRNNTRFEDLTFVYTEDNTSLVQNKQDNYNEETRTSSVQPTDEMMERLRASTPKTVIGIHNHPGSGFISGEDGAAAAARQYKYGLIIGHSGIIYKYNYSGPSPAYPMDVFDIHRTLEKIKEKMYNNPYITETMEELLKKLDDVTFHYEEIS